MDVTPVHNCTVFVALPLKFEITPFFNPLLAPNRMINMNIPQDTDKPVSTVRNLLRFKPDHIS